MGDPGDQTLQIILEAWNFFQEIQTDVATSCELTECELSAPSRHCNSFHTGHNGATPAMKVLDMMGNILCLFFVMENILCLCFVMGNILCLCSGGKYFVFGFFDGKYFVFVFCDGKYFVFVVCDGKYFVFVFSDGKYFVFVFTL